jgi:hypothetical protein
VVSGARSGSPAGRLAVAAGAPAAAAGVGGGCASGRTGKQPARHVALSSLLALVGTLRDKTRPVKKVRCFP